MRHAAIIQFVSYFRQVDIIVHNQFLHFFYLMQDDITLQCTSCYFRKQSS